MKKARTIAGDFWDLLSFRQYGSEFYEDQLIEANPDLHLVVRFDAGTEYRVPEVEPMPIEGLPPWRRVLKIR
jgi:phage tail protein X